MGLGALLNHSSPYLLAAGLAAAIIATLVVASFLGRRSANRGRHFEAGAIEAMASGLLGLLLAFNFSIAQSRFDVRQQMLVKEATGIGTAYLRCSVLPTDRAQTCRQLFRRYVDLRIEGYEAYDRRGKEAILVTDLAEGERVQQELWSLASREVRETPTVGNVQLMTALNEVIDLDEERRASIRIAVPRAVSFAIVVVCLAWAGLIGYASGARKSSTLGLWVVVAIPISVVFGVALDFDHPRSGVITTKAAELAMTHLADSMRTPPKE